MSGAKRVENRSCALKSEYIGECIYTYVTKDTKSANVKNSIKKSNLFDPDFIHEQQKLYNEYTGIKEWRYNELTWKIQGVIRFSECIVICQKL